MCTWYICNKSIGSVLLFKSLRITRTCNIAQNNIFTLAISLFPVPNSLLRKGSIGDRPVSPAAWLSICQRHNSLQQLLHVWSHSKSLSYLAHNLLNSGLSRRRNYSANLVCQFGPCWFNVWSRNNITNYVPKKKVYRVTWIDVFGPNMTVTHKNKTFGSFNLILK